MTIGGSHRFYGTIVLCTALLCWRALLASGDNCEDKSPLLRWEDTEYSTADFCRYLKSQGRYENRQEIPEPDRIRLAQRYLISRFYLNEARQTGYDSDPESQENYQKILQRAALKAFRERLVSEEPQITEKEVQAYYDSNVDSFREPEIYVFQHIFLNFADLRSDRDRGLMSEGQLRAALSAKRERAREALSKLRAAGEVASATLFTELALEYSESGGTERPQERGMELTATVNDKGQLEVYGRPVSDSMQQHICSLKSGGYTDVFESNHGLEILYLKSHDAAKTRSLDEVRSEIVARLGREIRARFREEQFEAILDRFDIQWKEAVLEEPNLPDETVVLTMTHHGTEQRFTLTAAQYYESLNSAAPQRRAEIDSSSETRQEFIRKEILPREALWILAQEERLDEDPEIVLIAEEALKENLAGRAFMARCEERVETPSESEMREFWSAPHNAHLFTDPPQVRAAAIVFPVTATPSMRPFEIHDLRRFAELAARKAIERLSEGQEIEQVARAFLPGASPQRSLQPGPEEPAADRGVDLLFSGSGGWVEDTGWLTDQALRQAGVMETAARESILSLRPGDTTTEPVGVYGAAIPIGGMFDGWLVLRVTDRRESQSRSFEESRERILARLRPPLYRRARQAEQEDLSSRLRVPAEESPEDYGTPLFDLLEPAWSRFWER